MNVKKIIKNPYLWAFLIGIASLHIIKEMAMRRRHAPPPMAIVPEWQLVDQEGHPFGQKEMLGKVVVSNFFFTSCPSICPKITEAMKEIHQRFVKKPEQVDFISITVDPEFDKPEILKSFMQKHNFYVANWHALTGTKEEVYDVVVNKMKVHMGEREAVHGAPGVYDIPHIGHLALFDQKGALRGLFKTESVEMAALVRAVEFLLEKGPDDF